MKGLYNPKAFIVHAAWLDQACAHCPRFPTAASRRSLGRVSVPVLLIILSNQLLIVGLVGHYPTNYLIRRGPISHRNSFPPHQMPSAFEKTIKSTNQTEFDWGGVYGINLSFPRLFRSERHVPTRY